MKRKSDRATVRIRIVVSRTTVRMHALQILLIMYVICTCNAGISSDQTSEFPTTPMIPMHRDHRYRRASTNATAASNMNNQNFSESPFNNNSSYSDNSNSNVSNSNSNTRNNYAGNSTLSTGNDLWDGIIRDCYRKPTFSCFQKNVFTYLDNTLNIVDVNVTERLKFLRNRNDYSRYSRKADTEPYEDNEIPNEPRSESPIEEVTNALYGKGVKFMMTHDIELRMPEMMFDGATFRISPRSIEGNGAIVKLELVPKTEIDARESGGRLFFIKKKIQKLFKNKLLLAFLALILIIKIIKIKIFWLLPLIVGVGTAKKLILKFLLFLFPALSHIFKLCSWYHTNYHQTKYHHHHHLINHHHTIVPPWAGGGDHDHTTHSAYLPNGQELIFTKPPKGHPVEYLHGGGPSNHPHYSQDWDLSGPGLGSEYINDIHRNALVGNDNFKPKLDDVNEINAWGLGTTYSPTPSHSFSVNPLVPESNRVVTQKLKPQGPVYTPSTHKNGPQAAAQIAAQYDPQQQAIKQAQAQEAFRIQNEQRLIAQQQKILQQQPFIQDAQPIMPKGYDPFYSPILTKIDKILLQMGFTDDYCKERLVCSMYKNPNRYSPHSNFISAELSRDTSELQKPSETNASVIRFYRYVQAARDGQEHGDCLRLYPQCTIATE